MMSLRKMIYQQTKAAINALTDLLDEYQAIGTVEECRAAVEKQKPKKPIDRCMYKECPACGSVEIQNCGYCTECGQKLDWSDEE